MRRNHWKRALLTAALCLGLTATAGAQMALDLDPADGVQGMKEAQAKPGGDMMIQVVTTEPVKDLVGVQIELKFDGKQVKFTGFMPAGILRGATAMPPKQSANGVRIEAALLGRKAGADQPAVLGELRFALPPTFGPETVIELVGGSLATAEGTKKLNLREAVKLVAEGAAKQMGDKPPQSSQMGRPQGGHGGPPMGGQPQGEPSPEEMKKMFGQWRRSPEAKDLNGDRKIDEEDFKLFMQQKMGPPQGGPGGPPMGPPQGGPGGPPMGPPQGGPGGPPMGPQQGGPGGPPMGPPQGGPGGPPMGPPQGGHGGPPMGQGHQQMGPMGPPMEMPPPEEVIATLPKALQPSFNKTLEAEDASHRAHMEAELKMLNAVLGTLKETQAYLPKASKEELDAISKALWYFHHQGPEPGPMGPGPGGPPMGPGHGGPGGPPMGGHQMKGPGPGGPPMMGPPEDLDAKELVQRMIDEVSKQIEEIKGELQNM